MKSKILTVFSYRSICIIEHTCICRRNTTLDPIVVSADFREAKLSETADSVTVIGEEEIYDKASAWF